MSTVKEIITFEKIVPGGKALGRLKNGKAVFCVGPLPGEVAEVEIISEKKSHAEATVVKIVQPSKYRSGETESHYLACAPWQGVNYDYQLQLKQAILADAFGQYKLDIKLPAVVASNQTVGYRNKLDFALSLSNGVYRLAFHSRGLKDQIVGLETGCRLGSQRMNALALQVAARLGEIGVKKAEALIVRQSTSNQQVLIQVIVAAGEQVDYSKLYIKGLTALVITLSAKPPLQHGKVLFRAGEPELCEVLGGLSMSYAYDNFFQTNPSTFAKTLADITSSVSAGRTIVELFGGVGAIGLALAASAKSVSIFEIAPPAITYAKRNIKKNKIGNATAEILDSTMVTTAMLENVDTVVVDPPRAGLARASIDALLASKPQQIVYLSCDPVTQCRDIALLSSGYGVKKALAYDYYPGTPHIESLVVLTRRA